MAQHIICFNSNNSLSFSKSENALVTNGFTSNANNHYYNALQGVEGIIIKQDIGIGYKYKFLNKIEIWDVQAKTLISEQDFHNEIYSKDNIKLYASNLLSEYIIKGMKMNHETVNIKNIKRQVNSKINKALSSDQSKINFKQIGE